MGPLPHPAPYARRLLVVVALLLAMGTGAPAGSAAASQGFERIESFDSTVAVQRDGDLLVSERIRYDFGGDERHGIFREIPVRFDYEPDNAYERLTPIEDISVDAGPGTPSDVSVEESGRLTRIRIGDPDRTISGVHDYTIRYRVRGALNAFEDHDELFWNATGNDWLVPISAVTATVEMPGPVSQVACYAGPRGSRLPCRSAANEGTRARFTHGFLSSQEGATIVVAVEKGVLDVPPPILDERWSFAKAFSITPATVVLSVGLLAAILFGLMRLVWVRGRDVRYAGSPVDVAFGSDSGKEEAVPLFDKPLDPVEYVPPDNVRPGEVGTLVDEVANPLDVTATIIDLAVRGFLRIEEIPEKGWFGKPDWKLIRQPNDVDLLRYERLLLDGLFEDGDEIRLSNLKRKFAPRLRKVQDALYDQVVSARWFATRPDHVRVKWRVVGVIAVVLAVGAAILLAAVTTFGLVGIPLVAGALGLLGLAGRLPRRTAKGWAALRRVSGFRRFIEESEMERARFAERAHLFTEYLPYAVVFGATEKWARAFAGLEDEIAQSTTSWYVSSHAFSMNDFGESMDSFAVTTAGTIVATAASSGSSGFGGGGSSGGGFGGGGGGSW
ncbi:MAG: DUF2207 domain-containing protein [Actinomycetota bacterium]|nr:DUF2207 domain-containing protein [Actinomycetota bacterium]